jgi:hypothetical protein
MKCWCGSPESPSNFRKRNKKNCSRKRKLSMEEAGFEAGFVLMSQKEPKPRCEPLTLYVCRACQYLHWGNLKKAGIAA